MEFFILIAAVLLAFFVKGLTGFANTLIFTSISGFFMSNSSLSPVDLMLTFPSNIILVFKNRKKVKWKTAAFLSFLVILGAIPGIIFLKDVDQSLLKIVFGFVVILVGVEMFLREQSTKKAKSNIFFMGAIGLISGVLCGLFGIGAFLAAYVSRTTDNADAFKGTLNVVFITDNIFRLILYISTGILTFQSFTTFLWLAPFMLIALYVGIHMTKKLNEDVIKKWVVILLILSGISLIVTNLI